MAKEGRKTLKEKEEDAIFRFLGRIRPQENGCWFYVGARSRWTEHGCGWDGQRSDGAHRLSWRLFVGPIGGLQVLHKECCTATFCVRPDHLYLGTHDDNVRDCWVWGAGAALMRLGKG